VALVRDFDRDALANSKCISEILRHHREVFYSTSVEILKYDADSRAAQYLVKLLVTGNLLFRALCEPALDRARVTELARLALREDPLIDVKIARQLADNRYDAAGGVGTGIAERVLEILEEISDGKRILSPLLRMLLYDNPHLRSKAVLMIGRSGRNLRWLKRRLKESDTRVRANAIEAMWGFDSAGARELLEWASRDGNNRVAGNALFGLYQLGEIYALAELAKMASHDSAAFRRTAAWVMGKTGDPRFAEVLGHMIADNHADVRKSAFAAVGRIRAAVAQASHRVEWPVAASCGPKDPNTGQRRVSVAVVSADGSENPRVLPAQFILSENGQPVWSYRLLEKEAPEAMTIIFLFPCDVPNWEPSALRCMSWKRSKDLWSVAHYTGGENSPAAPAADLDLPLFIANASQAAPAVEKTPERTDCTSFWSSVHRAVMPGNTPVSGTRHMIVLAPEYAGNCSEDEVIAAVHASRTSIQVLSPTANPGLRDFCSRVNGRFQLLEDMASVEERISLAYLSLLARYEIRYQPVSPDASSLKLRVQTLAGWGETIAPFPESLTPSSPSPDAPKSARARL
jgi:hypothetical protein